MAFVLDLTILPSNHAKSALFFVLLFPKKLHTNKKHVISNVKDGVVNTVIKGVTSRGWFVSEVLGGDQRTTHGTWDGFQSPKTFGEVVRWIRNRVRREGLRSSVFSPTPRPYRPPRAGV